MPYSLASSLVSRARTVSVRAVFAVRGLLPAVRQSLATGFAAERARGFYAASIAAGSAALATVRERFAILGCASKSVEAVQINRDRSSAPSAAAPARAAIAIEQATAFTLGGLAPAFAAVTLQNHAFLTDEGSDPMTDESGDTLLAVN